jgi:hypothetical protein
MKGNKMNERIIEQLIDTFKQDFELAQNDLGALEQAVQEKMQLLGKGLLQKLLDSGSHGYQGGSIACRCGNSMKFVQHRPKNIHTVFGWIMAKRSYYYCPDCGGSSVPFDKASGLGGEQISPGLAQACCLLAVDDSFQQVSYKIEQLFGQRICDDTVKQVVHKAGSVALQQHNNQLESFFTDRQIPEAQVNPQRLYITVDGTTVPEDDGWHEAKVGCIYWLDEQFKRQKRYIASFDNSAIFGWQLWLEACRCGLRQAKEVVYIGDGAGWIRTEQQKHFSKSTFIIDFYHTSEHIWDCGKILFGEGTKQANRWVHNRIDWLADGCTRKLLNDLKRRRKRHRNLKREALDNLIRYISGNEEQMRYDVFRSKGYDIGSGAVEAACKSVVGKRLKQSGMRWSRAGSSATLALRVTWLNNRWEKLWQKKPLAA